LAIVYGTIPIVPFRPFVGLLVFSWLAYMRPHDMAWLSGSRLSFHVAIATLIGCLIAVTLGRERLLTLKPQTILMIALGGWVSITGFTAIVPELSAEWVQLFAKIILMSVLTTGLVRSRDRYQKLMLVIAFSLGFLGLKYGVFGLLRGGARFYEGPGGFMSKNNPFALAMVMAIPLLLAVASTDRNRIIRRSALALIPFVIMTILFTFSRGGALAFGVVALLLLWRLRRPFLGLSMLLLSVSALFLVSSSGLREAYFERVGTITTYEEDPSAMGRVAAWKTSMRMFQDHPLYGVGPRNFMTAYERYGLPGETVRVAHNSFLQMLAEDGLPGFALFLALVVVTLGRLEILQRKAGSDWIETHARMLQISIAAYITAGMFLDMAYFDLFYHLIALSVSLEVIAQQGESEASARPTRDSPAAIPWWRRPVNPEA